MEEKKEDLVGNLYKIVANAIDPRLVPLTEKLSRFLAEALFKEKARGRELTKVLEQDFNIPPADTHEIIAKVVFIYVTKGADSASEYVKTLNQEKLREILESIKNEREKQRIQKL